MDNDCIGCIHYRAEHHANLMCNYLFDTGRVRPCPPGRGCSAFIPKPNFKKSTEKSDNQAQNK